MQQLKAMLLKEWYTHKKTFLIPLWVISVIYILSVVGYLYGSVRYGTPNILNSAPNPQQLQLVLWAIHYSAAIFIAWLCLLTALSLADGCLNQDYHKRCEIFHLSQPVSLAKILGSKALFCVGGVFVQYLMLAFLNYLVLAAVLAMFGFSSFGLGINALLNTIPYILSALLLVVPLMWFFSSLFRKAPFVKFMLFFAVYEVVRFMLEAAWNVKIFSLLGYYNRLIFAPFEVLSRFNGNRGMIHFSLVNWDWNWSATWDQLIWFGINVALIIASYFIYKRRSIS